MRRELFVFQFTVAQTLITGTLIVVSQMNFFQNTFVDFDKEHGPVICAWTNFE